jgi:hypothetical protein
MNPGAIVWSCHACGAIRDDQWISVAIRKVQLVDLPGPIQFNARYCNDRAQCLLVVVAVLDGWVNRLFVAKGPAT